MQEMLAGQDVQLAFYSIFNYIEYDVFAPTCLVNNSLLEQKSRTKITSEMEKDKKVSLEASGF